MNEREWRLLNDRLDVQVVGASDDLRDGADPASVAATFAALYRNHPDAGRLLGVAVVQLAELHLEATR